VYTNPGARLAIGPAFEPGGGVFAVYVLLVSAIAAGALVTRFMPPLPALLGTAVQLDTVETRDLHSFTPELNLSNCRTHS